VKYHVNGAQSSLLHVFFFSLFVESGVVSSAHEPQAYFQAQSLALHSGVKTADVSRVVFFRISPE
jgi:hypothetical protein